MRILARMLLLGTLAALAFPLFNIAEAGKDPSALALVVGSSSRPVFLGQNLAEEDRIALAVAAAATNPHALVLFDSPRLAPYLKAFFKAYRPDQIIPVGAFPEGRLELEQRLGVRTTPIVSMGHGAPVGLWRAFFARAETVVVCPTRPRAQLLQAACLAGILKAPLYLVAPESCAGAAAEAQRQASEPLRHQLAEWGTRHVNLVGKARALARSLPGAQTTILANEHAVAQACIKQWARSGPIETLVIANPFDHLGEGGGMATLAPQVCLQKKAALLLTDQSGTNVPQLVESAMRQPSLRHVDAVIYLADLKAIPVEQRPNPIAADKDPQIEMEPLTPTGSRPFTYATGRLFHEDPAVVPLLLARQRLLACSSDRPRSVLVASNPGDSLPLLETFSRNTVQEFRNAGYGATALFGKDVKGPELRHLMPEHDIFLWEGHHNTLITEFDLPSWDEPLRPSLVFLQSCLALKDYKVQPLLSRGAVGVVGSSTRTYSASGGACSLAFFNALLYDDQTLGGSLRQAKNFLLAYSMLKEKRLGKAASRTGANLRTAWAFTLWGDPTLKLPAPTIPNDARSAVRHEVTGNTIVMAIPEEKHDKVATRRDTEKPGYHTQMSPNARLAGMVRKAGTEDGKPLVPFLFAEVHLPNARPGATPTLHGRLPSSHWVFCWDERRRTGYLLATPRSQDTGELRFHVEWSKKELEMRAGY